MAEGPRAPLLRATPGAAMGATIPPESQSQLASSHDEGDPHESVTIAPPAPNFDELLRQATASLSNRSDQGDRAAVDAGSRAGSSLTELSKLVADLSRGLSGARQANEQLVLELGTLRAMLGSANEQQLSLGHHAAQLEQELLDSQSVAERERRFLTEQQDAFLAAILEEHDTECGRALEALAKAQMQRDEAQARAEKCERERDELRAEASQLLARRPPSVRPPREPPAELEGAVAPADPVSTAEALPRGTTSPGVDPQPSLPPPPDSFAPPPSGWTPPPTAAEPSETPRPAVISAASLPPGPSSHPALKQKPDPTTRPLIDYSLGGDGVLSETLEGARLSSKPPRK